LPTLSVTFLPKDQNPFTCVKVIASQMWEVFETRCIFSIINNTQWYPVYEASTAHMQRLETVYWILCSKVTGFVNTQTAIYI